MEIAHKTSAHIFNVLTYNYIMDMHTFLSSSFQMMFETYAYHVIQQNFYVYQINY